MKKSNIAQEQGFQSGLTYENRIPMQYWAEDDIPGEKLLLKGTASLSDVELLSILIGSGTTGENPLHIAQNILVSCENNLCTFWQLGYSELLKFKGIGKQRALQIISMFSLARRRNAAEVIPRMKVSSSKDAYTVFHSLIGELPYEEFWMLLLNRANKIMKTVNVSEGGISGALLEISVLDHIIVAHDVYYSFANEGTM